jgi:hypothetical protein
MFDSCPDHTKTFRLVATVKLLGIMFQFRCWSTTFYTIRASPSCRVKRDLASPLTRPWRKTCPTLLQSRGLDCQGSSNFRLHSLSSRVSVALAAPTFRGLIHLQFNESCHFWESWGYFVITGNIPDGFSGWRASMQVTVAECHPKQN